MAIPFKVVEKGQPGVAGGGERKFYAATVSNGESSLESLTKSIEGRIETNLSIFATNI